MTGAHKQPDEANHDSLDHELDAALAKYAAVEPRAGLEARILANLRTQPSHSAIRNWWRWSAAAALAAMIVIAVALAWRSSRPSHPLTAGHPSVATPAPNEPGPQFVANTAGNIPQPQGHTPAQTVRPHRSAPTVVVSAEPKLDQFPSPQPLSEQEQILANYVVKYPERAALIAEARMEALRRDAEEIRQEDANSLDFHQESR